MLTSARIRSGFASRAWESASFPSDTTVRVTSSALNVISTAFWMVTESSARSRDLGTFRSPPDRCRSIPPVPVLAKAGKLSELQRSQGAHGLPQRSGDLGQSAQIRLVVQGRGA